MSGPYLQIVVLTSSLTLLLSLKFFLLPAAVTGFYNIHIHRFDDSLSLPTTCVPLSSTTTMTSKSLMIIRGFTYKSHLNQRKSTRMFNTVDDDVNDSDDDGDDSLLPLSSSSSSSLGEGFNPFEYRRGNTGMVSSNNNNNSTPSSSSQQSSIRSIRMGSLTNELLNVLGDETSIRRILEESRDFLLEPLEEEAALAGSGSIYTPGMTRFERYQAYRASVNRRLQTSRNGQAKAVLKAMSDYVLQFENERPS